MLTLDRWFRPVEPKLRYDLVGEEEAAGADAEHSGRRSWSIFPTIAVAALVASILSYTFIVSSTASHTSRHRCAEPTIRREWRMLSAAEKSDYTRAFNCLSKTESVVGRNSSLYDDFSWLHQSTGMLFHEASSFLPWHRYLLHHFENTLQTRCGLTGHIPYWDWSLDWRDLANSSIWHETDGFGGDGDPAHLAEAGNGSCVLTGPFSQLTPVMYNVTYHPHCFSRSFHDGGLAGKLPSVEFSPDRIGEILNASTYEEFVFQVESTLHNPMHLAIGGDFAAWTAPNDPIFFLHHAQLDRLWWYWQQRNPDQRLHEYRGKHMTNSTTDGATVQDYLLYDGFAKDVPVSEVMDTRGPMLCYAY